VEIGVDGLDSRNTPPQWRNNLASFQPQVGDDGRESFHHPLGGHINERNPIELAIVSGKAGKRSLANCLRD
jgi:hypothetical protein